MSEIIEKKESKAKKFFSNVFSWKTIGRVLSVAAVAALVFTGSTYLAAIPGISTALATTLGGISTIGIVAATGVAGLSAVSALGKGLVNLGKGLVHAAKYIFNKSYREKVKAARQERKNGKNKNKADELENKQTNTPTNKETKDKAPGNEPPVENNTPTEVVNPNNTPIEVVNPNNTPTEVVTPTVTKKPVKPVKVEGKELSEENSAVYRSIILGSRKKNEDFYKQLSHEQISELGKIYASAKDAILKSEKDSKDYTEDEARTIALATKFKKLEVKMEKLRNTPEGYEVSDLQFTSVEGAKKAFEEINKPKPRKK